MGISLIALLPTLVSGIGLRRGLPDNFEGDPRQVSDESSEYAGAADDYEDVGLVSTMLSEFEKDAEIYDSFKGTNAVEKVAVVAVGNVRTFVLPGVYSSISKNLISTFPGTADWYLVAHLGQYIDKVNHGAEHVDVKTILHKFYGSEEMALNFALNDMRKHPTHVEIHAGSLCHHLNKARKEFGTHGPDCTHANGHLMQVLWMDHAFQQIEKSGPYSNVVRIRPDVAVFHPFPWDRISQTSITYALKRDVGMVDWAFVMPPLFLNQTWPSVVQRFVLQSNNVLASPDMVWHFHGKMISFPVVVVRSGGTANCKHVKDNHLYGDCKQLCKTRWFMDKH
jgi:hypothetical protein